METNYPAHQTRGTFSRGADMAIVACVFLYVVNNTTFPWMSTFIMLLTTLVIAAGLRRPASFLNHLSLPCGFSATPAAYLWFVPVWFRVTTTRHFTLRLPRELTIALVIAIFLSLFALFIVKVPGLLVSQAYDIGLGMPGAWVKMRAYMQGSLPEPMTVWLSANMNTWLPEFSGYLKGAANNLKDFAGAALSMSLSSVGEGFGVLLFAFLIARQEGTIAGLISPLIPARRRNEVARLTNSTMRAIGQCVCAQLVAGAVWALGYTAYLYLTGAEYWFPVGLSALILESLIPFVGGFMAVAWALLIEFAHGNWMGAASIFAGYAVLVILQRRLVYRRLMAHIHELDAIKSMGSLFVMIKFFGVIGFLLAIPSAIIVQKVLAFIHPEEEAGVEPHRPNVAGWYIARNIAFIIGGLIYVLNNSQFPWMTTFVMLVTAIVLTAFLRRPAAWLADLPIPYGFAIGEPKRIFGIPVWYHINVTRAYIVHIPRDVTCATMLLGFVVMGVYAGISVVPLVVNQAVGISNRLPGSWTVIRTWLQHNLPEPVATLTASNMESWLPELTKYLTGAADYLSGFVGSMLSLSIVTMAQVLFIIGFSFLFARREGTIAALVTAVLPRRKRADVKELIDRTMFEIGECVCAQLISGAVFAIAFMGFLYVARGDYWFTVGLSSLTLESIMPWVGGIMAVFAAIFIEASHLDLVGVITVVVGYVVLAFVQWHIVYPLLMSRMSQLDTLKSLGSLYLGFKALGLMGSLLAIPLAIVIANLLKYAHPPEPDLPGTDLTVGSDSDDPPADPEVVVEVMAVTAPTD